VNLEQTRRFFAPQTQGKIQVLPRRYPVEPASPPTPLVTTLSPPPLSLPMPNITSALG